MKTKLMALALAAVLSMGGMSAAAQGHKAHKGHKTSKECVVAGKNCKQGCDVKAARYESLDCQLLEGITLTPEQQTKFKALQQQRRADFKERGEKAREMMQKRAEKAQEKMQQNWDKMDKDMKKILDKEQYGKFKKNLDKVKTNRGKHLGQMKHHKNKKMNMKKDCKKNCKDCKGAACPNYKKK